MGTVVSFWDGRELEFQTPEIMDNFGSVVGFSFDQSCGKIDVAMSSVEVTSILNAVCEWERKKESPNYDLISHIEDTCDELMEEGIELIAKCIIAQNYAKIEPSPPTNLDEFI